MKNTENSNKPRILYLTLSAQAFEVMVTGEKTTEYRKPCKWIFSRLKGKIYDYIKFSNGYGRDRPYFIADYRGWENEKAKQNTITFSNGLTVESKVGTVKIYLGKIVEKNNLKSK